MNNEEFERKVEFIVNQQAQFTVDIQKLQEAQAVTEQEIARANKAAAQASEVAGLAAGVAGQAAGVAAQAAEAVAATADTVSRFANATHEGFRHLFDSFKQTNAKLDTLVDLQIRTDERLQNLIAVVDRHIREGHKGLNGA